MPLPDLRTPIVQAPARAGVGLAPLPRKRFAMPGWPATWWQRNYDLPYTDPDAGDPVPLYGRQLTIPPPPGGAK